METPREILRRAGERRRPAAGAGPVRIASAAPRPAPVAPQPASVKPLPEQQERVVVPQPIRANSVYRQLMRSHDRMHTQHLQG